jgi:WD40 repeat protein
VVKKFVGGPSPLAAVDISADGLHFLSASGGPAIQLWRVDRPPPIHVFDAAANVTSAEFVFGDRRIISQGGGHVRMWSVDEKKEIVRLAKCSLLAVSPSGKSAVCWSELGGDLLYFDAGSGRQIARFKGHEQPALAAGFSLDEKRLITAAADGTVRVWRLP